MKENVDLKKIPVYGYVHNKDGTRERRLAAYALLSPSGVPMLEVKTGQKLVWVNLPVLFEQIRKPPNYMIGDTIQ